MGIFDDLENAAKGAAENALQGSSQAIISQAVTSCSGGMSGLLQKLRDGGLGEHVDAWLAGTHLPISSEQLQQAMSDEHINEIASCSGQSVQQILASLATHLPAISQQQQS
jgi:uncharacterized protein YidB (DUF937 family)